MSEEAWVQIALTVHISILGLMGTVFWWIGQSWRNLAMHYHRRGPLNPVSLKERLEAWPPSLMAAASLAYVWGFPA